MKAAKKALDGVATQGGTVRISRGRRAPSLPRALEYARRDRTHNQIRPCQEALS